MQKVWRLQHSLFFGFLFFRVLTSSTCLKKVTGKYFQFFCEKKILKKPICVSGVKTKWHNNNTRVKCGEPIFLEQNHVKSSRMNPATESPIPVRQALARSATAPPPKTISRRSLSTSPPPSAPFTHKYFFMHNNNNNNNNNNYEGGTGHVHRSNQRRAYNSRYTSDIATTLRPVLSQQQAEARNLMLNEIKALQLRRQGSFKRMLRLPMWGSGTLHNCLASRKIQNIKM